jgi:hypothetical protein
VSYFVRACRLDCARLERVHLPAGADDEHRALNRSNDVLGDASHQHV